MSQMRLNDQAGETLHRVAGDIDSALRYIDGDTIKKEFVEKWRDDLQKVLGGEVVRERTPGRKRSKGAEA